jgi:cobalt-zinc-cadmium efflux system outer membrane protein
MKRILLFILLGTQPLLAVDFRDRESVVAAALESHPTLASLRLEADAARERIRPAQALPNPMLMGGVQNKQIDLADDEMMTMYMLGASQKLVRPAKREAARDIAALTAGALEQQVVSARAEIERDALLAWYDLAIADAQIETANGVRDMIDAVIAAARVRYEVGSALQADVIRAQLQQSDLDHEILRLRGVCRAAAARLVSLLGLPYDTDVPAVPLPADEGARDIDGPPVPPHDHPAILALEREVARAEAEIRLADAARVPDIDLEAQYGYRAMQRDMFTLTARIELPLRKNETIEPRVREAILRRDAATARIAELRRALTGAMAAAISTHEETNRQIEFHQQVLVPQSQLAFESTLAAYQTGAAPFDSILTTETAYLRLRLQYYDFLARHAQAIVNYDALRRSARTAVLGASSAISSPGSSTASPSGMGGM